MIFLLFFSSLTVAQLNLNLGNWHKASDGSFDIYTQREADREHLTEVFEVLQKAKRDLYERWGLRLEPQVTILIHPDLTSFQRATKQPWYIVAIAKQTTMQIDSQRLDILIERHILEASLRHELFHLVQPKTLRRYEAEGLAMRFAGERPQAEPFSMISNERLDDILAQPTSAELLTQAMSTAYERTHVELLSKP